MEIPIATSVIFCFSLLAAPAPLKTTPTPADFPPDAFGTGIVAGDIDCDRDIDIIAWENNGIDPYVLLNNGTGRFSRSALKPFGALTGTNIFFKIVLEDVDRDGDLDAFTLSSRTGTHTPQPDHLFLNDGKGVFQEADGLLPYRATVGMDAVFADIDADGDRDLFIACGSAVPTVNAQDLLYLNDGLGKFTDHTDSRVPAMLDPSFGAAAGDIDADGDLDLIVTRRFGPVKILVNSFGKFLDESESRIAQSPINAHDHAMLVDVDGDDDSDLIVGTVSFGGSDWNERDRLFINNDHGQFLDATERLMPDIRTSTAGAQKAAGDLDGDGRPEFFLPNSAGRGVIYSPRKSKDGIVVEDRTDLFLPGSTNALAGALFFDADGDGDLDIVGSHQERRPLKLWRR